MISKNKLKFFQKQNLGKSQCTCVNIIKGKGKLPIWKLMWERKSSKAKNEKYYGRKLMLCTQTENIYINENSFDFSTLGRTVNAKWNNFP